MAVHLVGRVRGRRASRVWLRPRDSAIHGIRRGHSDQRNAEHRYHVGVTHQYRYRADAFTEAVCGVQVAIIRKDRGEVAFTAAICGIHIATGS
jgi:hypothetical protein